MAQEVTDLAPVQEGDYAPSHRPSSPTGLAIRRLLRKRIACLAIIFILLFYVAGTLAPLLSGAGVIRAYDRQNLELAYQGPTMAHPFGTDALGRDQLSRVIWSAQTTVIITVLTLFTGGLVLSIGLGLLSGYAGGWIDTAIMRAGDILACLPSFLILILINATMKGQVRTVGFDVERWTGLHGIVKSGVPDYVLIFGTLSLFSWVGGARIIRAQILALRETDFITAAESLGASTPRVLFRHLLPNVSNYLLVSMSMGLAGIAGSEIFLTWFGIGIQPPHPSFGALIYDASGIRTINAHFYLLAFPAGITTTLFFAFNLLGDALTDVFTPKAR